MRYWIAFTFFSLMVAACSGQTNGNFTVAAGTPTSSSSSATRPVTAGTVRTAAPGTAQTATPTRVNTPASERTPTASTEFEQPPSPGGQEQTLDQLPPDIVLMIQTQLAGRAIANPPHAYLISKNESDVESQYRQQLSAAGWQSVAGASALIGQAKVMVLQKGQVRAHVILLGQSGTETMVYILTTKG